jgi:predicted metal-dependent peptidase
MKIERAYKRLLIENPFYGLFLLGISKVIDTSTPTACVRKRGISCELVINPEFWETQNDIQQMNLIQHEVYHIVFQHMFMYNSFPNKEVLNLAADCEVNSYLQNLDSTWVTPSIWNLKLKGGTKYYYEEIMKQCPPQSKSGSTGGNGLPQTADDHSHWQEDFQNCSEAEKQLIKNQINSQIKTAAEQTKRMRGTIPGEIQVIVDELLKVKPRIFDWKSYFRRMLGSIYDVNIKKTRRKESIRFPESAGIKHKKKVSILVAVDTSGSVGNKELQDFFSEITYIYRAGARVTILECDSKISANYEYNGKWTGKVHGRGGTDFQPVIDYYRKNRKEYSALVYFTDGECDLPNNTPRDTIWVITSDGKHQDYPGKTIYIPKSND